MAKFAVEFVYGSDVDKLAEVRPSHREYLDTLVEKGVLLLSGPYADGLGALLVFEAADEAELRGYLAADPYAPAKVVETTTVHEWNAVKGTLL
ncbi:YciI family protein [Umezawaea sp. Da 62-37]|uniref:YciI family protein n=1 Tax=Umezawaea sp. Da 62-37 TaxID=3075927 RepID=UPI0028F74508|nr:YciI family protein [Umezawaea sp. Da 62-37]WNV91252.1 YciI family protein [Umezawaea sp. Da 62-37]